MVDTSLVPHKTDREERRMSPKELLYIEDVLGHEEQMKTACADLANQIQDAELKNFVQGLCTKHQDTFNRFYSLLK